MPSRRKNLPSIARIAAGSRKISGQSHPPDSCLGTLPHAPVVFIHPCQPIVVKQPPTGPGWAHELQHDGYRLEKLSEIVKVHETR
jgi:ATP-dependent DNA ligase